MHPVKSKLLTPWLLLVVSTCVRDRPVPLAVSGDRPTSYVGFYPNACIDQLHPTHWPFGGTTFTALVASGFSAYGD